MKKPRIGFIGQGYIGKNYADDFERRGFKVVRYSLEEPYVQNKEKIKECKVVFLAVPTPTTPKGFDASVVEGALALLAKGSTAVIKSTILPGTTARLQKKYPKLDIFYSPEFLSEATAAKDAAHPFSNIIGITKNTALQRSIAKDLLALLPKASFVQICSSTQAELIKYAHNLNGYFQIVLSNILFDTANILGADWKDVQKALMHDPFISNRYSKPQHKSGRGAGGHCFIKDFAAFKTLYAKAMAKDAKGRAVLSALEKKNIELLRTSKKDVDLLRGVYGKI